MLKSFLIVIIVSLTAIFTNCTKKEVVDPKSNSDYRDSFTGKWKFNGSKSYSSEYSNYSNSIVNYEGSISKSTNNEDAIIIQYYKDGSQTELEIDSTGNIRNSSGTKLGKITNNKTLDLSWQTESEGMNGGSMTVVYLKGTKL